MANKNTKRARRGSPKNGVPPISNQAEVTIGTGAGRQFGVRNFEEIFKGKPCDTSRPSWKRKWVGAMKASKGGE
jgi:hypothetical protein